MSLEKHGVLVIAQDSPLKQSILAHLKREEYEVLSALPGPASITQLKSHIFQYLICDFISLDEGQYKLLSQYHEIIPQSFIIVLGDSKNAQEVQKVLRHGAYDYLGKPFALDDLLLALKKIEERENLRSGTVENEINSGQNKYSFANIVAHSKAMKNIFETVKRLAQFNTTVLVTGESGTGKELLARAIHHNSPRRGKPFIAINCGAIPENLMESELFGHKKGAFTDATRDKKGLFEEANGGTVFLDEIGEMPLHLQVKLLRALQEQSIRRVGDEQLIHIDVRVIAATLRNLEEDVKVGRFRDDLFYRLNVVSIHIPPLRDREEDIPVLVQHFIKKHAKRLNLPICEIGPETMKCLLGHIWKGNVRELENCIERALVLTETETIELEVLPPVVRSSMDKAQGESAFDAADDNLSIKEKTKNLEIQLIRRALQKTKGNRTRAAKILEISHRALLYKLKEYGV